MKNYYYYVNVENEVLITNCNYGGLKECQMFISDLGEDGEEYTILCLNYEQLQRKIKKGNYDRLYNHIKGC